MDKRKIAKYNWKIVQDYYNLNHTLREVMSKFGMAICTLYKAKARGDFSTRTHKESMKIRFMNYKPYKHSEETKRKISEIRRKYLKEHPEKMPFLLYHSSKESFPEKYFRELFEKENIPLQQHQQVGLYELDFYNISCGLAVEIDGELHFSTEKAIERDKKRDEFLQENGWFVYRIRWSEYQKLSIEKHHEVVQTIKDLINDLTNGNKAQPKLVLVTKTYNNCIDCQGIITRYFKRCRKCARKLTIKFKIEWPESQWILEQLKTKSFCQLGRELGVSDNSIRKHIKKYSEIRVRFSVDPP